MVNIKSIDGGVRRSLLALWNTESSLLELIPSAEGEELLRMLSILSKTREAIQGIEDGFKESPDDICVLTNGKAFLLCGQAKDAIPIIG